jgi:stage II sporulation protein D
LATALFLLSVGRPGTAWAEDPVRVLLFERAGPVRLTPQREGSRIVAPLDEGEQLLLEGERVDSPLRLGGEGLIAVDGAPYQGIIEVYAGGGRLSVVNVVPLEAYVAGTLHRELYRAWGGAELLAQAVAIRTYALYRMRRARGRLYHLDATAGDQVYGGVAAETPAARRATDATRGQYLSYAGHPILAVYHSASGGQTASAQEVWGRPVPYLVSVDVPGEEASPDAYWRASVSVETLEALLEGAGLSGAAPASRWGHAAQHAVRDPQGRRRFRARRFRSWPRSRDESVGGARDGAERGHLSGDPRAFLSRGRASRACQRHARRRQRGRGMTDTAGLVWLQAGEGGAPDPFGFLLPMAAIFLIFYFLLIRPQQKQQKDHKKMLESVEKGDRVVTSGGLHGLITGATDDVLTLEISNVRGDRVRVKIDRSKVDRRIARGGDEE